MSRRAWSSLARMVVASALLVSSTIPVLACNVPVFRYALEHWHPDDYRAVVFHRGELSDAELQQIAGLEEQAESRRLNLDLRTVDVASFADEADRKLFESCQSEELPCLALQYPAYLRINQPVWSGRLAAEPVAGLIDSPVRQELLKRLTEGQTAVWLLLDSGDAAQDEAALELLSEELKTLQQTLKLPELTDSPEDVLLDGPKLRVEFSLLRVARSDASEDGLIDILLAAEEDLRDLNEPMVFPVFGRGRAMLPLIGAGISETNIRSSATFLAGACSCQVKELNPGFDLLVNADWGNLLGWADAPATAVGPQSGTDDREPEFVPIPSGTSAKTEVTNAIADEDAPAAASSPAASRTTTVSTLPTRAPLIAIAGLAILGVAAVFLRRR